MRKYIVLLIVTGFIMACTDHEKEKAGDNKMTEKEVAEFIKHYDDLWAKRDTTGMKTTMAENYIYFSSTGNTSNRDRIISWFTPAGKYKVDSAIRSEISVIVPIVPWPHMGRQPLVSINKTAKSFCGSCGGYKILPLIISCPRGSNINPFLIQSYSFKKCCRFSLMVFPSRSGPPSATSRTGLPHVCASMQ